MNAGYLKGRAAEYRVMRCLEAAGYTCCRAAGSHGPADVIAWDTRTIRFVSVKSGGQYASAVERETLQLMPKPANATAEIWRLPTRKPPVIEVLP